MHRRSGPGGLERQNAMHSIFATVLFLIPLAASAQQCPVAVHSLLGAWERKSNAGFFEQISFEMEGDQKVFNSWLHQRPEISEGTWRLEKCTIFIAHPTLQNFSVDWVVLKASKNRITVREVGENEVSVYQRIK